MIASCVEHGFECIEIFTDVASLDDIPSVAAETLTDIVLTCQRSTAIDRDSVVVEYAHQTI